MHLQRIQALEKLTDSQRFQYILDWAAQQNIKTQLHRYKTGQNIILPASTLPKIGIGSHFDTVSGTPGANDNASAMVVAMAIAERLQTHTFHHIGVEVFFFDEEERGLVGSWEYVKAFGIKDFIGFLNMELVGMGNQFAVWPVREEQEGTVLTAFEAVSAHKGIACSRHEQVVMNTADHETFRLAGLTDSFTLTCISDQDVAVASHYYKAQEFEVDDHVLFDIIRKAPIFVHYHQPTDKAIHLSETTLQMAVDTIWETLLKVDRESPANGYIF
ncbi:MAG: M28 family peptidase [Bacteroidota bacterium]